MFRPNDYDTAKAYDGTWKQLPVGGYICKILKAEEDRTKNGAPKLRLAIDVAEGEYKDFFLAQFNEEKRRDPQAKWRGTYETFVLDVDNQSTNPWFKGLIQCIEQSNPGFRFNFDENTLKGKRVGILFREEEFKGRNGDKRRVVKAFAARTVEVIQSGDYGEIEPKLLKEEPQDDFSYAGQGYQPNAYGAQPMNGYSAQPNAYNTQPGGHQMGFNEVQVEDDELPF